MRPVDADALMAKLNRKKAGPANQRYTEGFNDCLMRVRSMVHSAPTLTPPNEALTLEQLREMNGEPVYLVAKRYGISEWNILNGMDEIVLAYDEPVVGMKAVIPGIKFINGRILGVGSYGEDWLAYRRPKEEQ